MATHLRDEHVYLCSQEDSLRDITPHLAHQISVYHTLHGRFNSHHIHHIRQIIALKGFTGNASVGVTLDPINVGVGAAGEEHVECEDDDIEVSGELLDLQDEQEGQEEEEELDNDLLDIINVSMDHVHHAP
jgi:hypothetical protein